MAEGLAELGLQEKTSDRGRRLLQICLAVEIAAGVVWANLQLLVAQAEFSDLFPALLSSGILALGALIGLGAMLRADLRRLGAVLVALALVLFALPLGLRAIAGGALFSLPGARKLPLLLTMALPFAVPILAPRRVAAWLPDAFWQRRGLHLSLAVMAGGLFLVHLVLWPALYGMGLSGAADTRETIESARVFARISLCFGVAGALIAYVALFRRDPARPRALHGLGLAASGALVALIVGGYYAGRYLAGLFMYG